MIIKCWVYVACQETCQLLVALMAHSCQDQVLSSLFASLLQALWFCVQHCVGQCVFSLRSMSFLGINLKHAILQCSPKSCFIVKVKAGSCSTQNSKCAKQALCLKVLCLPTSGSLSAAHFITLKAGIFQRQLPGRQTCQVKAAAGCDQTSVCIDFDFPNFHQKLSNVVLMSCLCAHASS